MIDPLKIIDMTDQKKGVVIIKETPRPDGGTDTEVEIKPSKSGAVAGAAAGAAVGSVVPVIGTAVGTLVGGVIGFIFGPAD